MRLMNVLRNGDKTDDGDCGRGLGKIKSREMALTIFLLC